MNDVTFAGQHLLTPPSHRHQHDVWEMFCCLSGPDKFVFDDLEFTCREGDVIIIPPGAAHAQISEAGTPGAYLYVDNATLAFRYPVLLHDDDNQSLLHIFRDAHYLYQSTAEYRDALLPAYGQLLAQHISCRRVTSPRNLLVEEIAQSIVQNYANPNYELDELLKSAPYCYDYLCRLFRQEMHTTPHKYLMGLRLQAAADILRAGTGSSITEVARVCGYSDPLYFSRMFKKKYGVSPREYGRQNPE